MRRHGHHRCGFRDGLGFGKLGRFSHVCRGGDNRLDSIVFIRLGRLERHILLERSQRGKARPQKSASIEIVFRHGTQVEIEPGDGLHKRMRFRQIRQIGRCRQGVIEPADQSLKSIMRRPQGHDIQRPAGIAQTVARSQQHIR